MREMTIELKEALRQHAYTFFANESGMDVGDLNDEMTIMDDLDGDSLMFVELVESAKERFDMDIKLQVVGKYLLRKPADTLGEVVATMEKIYIHGNNIDVN